MHLPPLISDLALLLLVAGVTTLIFKKLRQPLVLGYIIAGLLVGKHFAFLPTIADEANINTWAEIGVIFLLFGLGLEFSFSKLMKAGVSALVTGLLQLSAMLAIGYAAGQMMGWNTVDSIFLGGILSISSTTIIIRTFEELGLKSQQFAGLVFGILVVEDLVAILLMVLLPTLAISREFEGMALLGAASKLGFFLILWFLLGIFLVPTVLRKVKDLMNEETILIVSLSLCLLMVVLAVGVGFSPALGAFMMGSILAETTYDQQIEHLTKPVKDLFGAVFFVSVGMLIDTGIMFEYAGPIIVLTIFIIVGKTLAVCIGALACGTPLKQSVQAGMSLAQIGEFSFIIATLGLSLKVTSGFLYPIAVALASITTFTTPYMIKLSLPLHAFLEKNIPTSWLLWLNNYSSKAQIISQVSDWQLVLRTYLSRMLIHSVMIIGILLLVSKIALPYLSDQLDFHMWYQILGVIATILLMSPFLWALTVRKTDKEAYERLWLNRKMNRAPLIALELTRMVLSIIYVNAAFSLFFSISLLIGAVVLLIVIALWIFSKKLDVFYSLIESRFISNLHERDQKDKVQPNNLLPWDAHIAFFNIPALSEVVGKTLQELNFRQLCEVNIVSIERGGGNNIQLPGRNERLYPFDKITAIGTDEAFASLQEVLNQEVIRTQEGESQLSLQQVLITENSPLLGKSIESAGTEYFAQALIVGLDRAGKRISSPKSQMVFQAGDLVWIAGNKELLKDILSDN